jgi:hypothetical protein
MMKSERATILSYAPAPSLTSVLERHGLGKSSGIALETLDGLVVELADGLGEDVSGTGDAASVAGYEGGEEGLGEPGKDGEAGLGDRLKTRPVGLEVLLRLDVDGETVTLTDHGAGELHTEAVLVLGKLHELIRVQVDTRGGATIVS